MCDVISFVTLCYNANIIFMQKDKNNLHPEQYRVLFLGGTEQKYSGVYYKHFEQGKYLCVFCKNHLANSHKKIDTDLGWATFTELVKKSYKEKDVTNRGYVERFLYCSNCGGHIGHIHTENNKRYFLLNSNSLTFNAD